MPTPQYNSISRTAELWHRPWITIKRWCVANRIPGAIFQNGRYLIPAKTRPSQVLPIPPAELAEIKRRRMAGRSVASGSGYRGVYRRRKRWAAIISVAGRPVHIGTYDTRVEAARAWDARARELRGEGAWVNLADEQ
jgi:hypothetical protein